MTLTAAESPYTGYATTIASGVTVTVEPGVVVKLNRSMIIDGTLNVQGSAANPVVFTSAQDSAPYQWKGLTFNSGAGASVLDHAVVRYTGYQSGNAIEISGSSPTITNSTIRDNGGTGISVGGGTPQIANNTIAGNGGGISAVLSPQSEIAGNLVEQSGNIGMSLSGTGGAVHDNTIRNNGNEGIRVNTGDGITIRDNAITGNAGYGISYSATTDQAIVPWDIDENALSGNLGGNAIQVSGTVNESTTWDGVFVLSGWNLTIAAGKTLTMAPGTVVKGTSSVRGIVVNGTLEAPGTAGQPITFTSIKDDTAGGDTNGDGAASQPGGGDWRGISYSANSDGGTLDHVRVSHGSWTYYGKPMIEINCPCPTPPRIVNSTISKSAKGGIQLIGGTGVPAGTLSVTNSTIRDNGGTGISVGGGTPQIANNTIAGNGGGISAVLSPTPTTRSGAARSGLWPGTPKPPTMVTSVIDRPWTRVWAESSQATSRVRAVS